MRRRTLHATVIAALLIGSVTLAASASAALRTRPSKAGWHQIQAAAQLRKTALGRHHTARFRSFAATLGLGQLDSIQPLGRGRCLTAVTYLYDNLLDLENAYPGENWNPLRRAVAKEPSIYVCAPHAARKAERSGSADGSDRLLGPSRASQRVRTGP